MAWAAGLKDAARRKRGGLAAVLDPHRPRHRCMLRPGRRNAAATEPRNCIHGWPGI